MPGPLAGLALLAARFGGSTALKKAGAVKQITKSDIKAAGINALKNEVDPLGVTAKSRRIPGINSLINNPLDRYISTPSKTPVIHDLLEEPKIGIKVIRRNPNRGDHQEVTYYVTEKQERLLTEDPEGWMVRQGDYRQSPESSGEHTFDFVYL